MSKSQELAARELVRATVQHELALAERKLAGLRLKVESTINGGSAGWRARAQAERSMRIAQYQRDAWALVDESAAAAFERADREQEANRVIGLDPKKTNVAVPAPDRIVGWRGRPAVLLVCDREETRCRDAYPLSVQWSPLTADELSRLADRPDTNCARCGTDLLS